MLEAVVGPFDSRIVPPKLLAGTQVLITAGPTFEPIDPVQASSAVREKWAAVPRRTGGRCTGHADLGPGSAQAPSAAQLVRVETARQMLDAVNAHIGSCDIFIGVAAVADYHVGNREQQKIKKDGAVPTLELVPNPDIIEAVARRSSPPFCVGFAAETENLYKNAEAKRRRKKLPLLAANLAQAAIGADDNELVLFDDDGVHRLAPASKLELARALIRHIAKLYRPRKTPVTA
jgi:phosphopantothenoylcysteine decarboxylase/phosphopantothenate--cysteine ligase